MNLKDLKEKQFIANTNTFGMGEIHFKRKGEKYATDLYVSWRDMVVISEILEEAGYVKIKEV